MPVQTFTLRTPAEGGVNITAQLRQAVRESGVHSGLCVAFSPHTTAGITINENSDPDVQRDMLLGLGEAFPDRAQYRHYEGNSDAHLKTSAVGPSQTVIIEDGELLLGRWQAVYFFEFDGPRTRQFHVKILSD